jgi:hypothetical protein
MDSRLTSIALIRRETHLLPINCHRYVVIVEVALALCARCSQYAYLKVLTYFLWRD